MAIICLEGASGIGKSTAARFMSNEFGYVRIPEVNELFNRPANESSIWYFQMQVKRWEMATDVSKSGNVAILDGDHLQPIWYNWIFEDLGFQPVREVMEFYRSSFSKGHISFPDAYVVLTLGADKLRARKERDQTRSRRNFETHMRLIEPQIEYFKALAIENRRQVQFLPSTSPFDIANSCKSIAESSSRANYSAGFDTIERFIASKVTNK